jgi:pimeloyl-ACP methyl ester carboxylesterase
MRALSLVAVLYAALIPAMASAQDKFFDSNGVQIRYLDQGSGEPVLLLHGYTSSIERGWIEPGVVANLAKDHRVIAFDLRGHGKSGKPRDPKAYGDQMGQDAVRLLDHLKIPRAHIVGYSLGAIITAKLLTTNADRFASATLGGHSGIRNWTPRDEESAEAAAAELESGIPFRALIIAVAPTDQPRPTDEDILKRSRELVAVNDRLALAAYNRSRRGLVATNAQMSAVRVPILGVIGSADAFITGMKELQGVLPALKVVVIDRATHSNNTGRGAAARPEFVGAIREFIRAHKVSEPR